jgi:hypothetical protein
MYQYTELEHWMKNQNSMKILLAHIDPAVLTTNTSKFMSVV